MLPLSPARPQFEPVAGQHTDYQRTAVLGREERGVEQSAEGVVSAVEMEGNRGDSQAVGGGNEDGGAGDSGFM